MSNPYTRQTWTDAVSALSAARLGVIETGIFDAHFQPAARAYHNANQAITTATTTALALNSERFDQDGLGTSTIHDNATNNSRLTCRVAGKYHIIGCVDWEAIVTGAIRLSRIRLNGATLLGSQQTDPSASHSSNTTVSALYDLAVNDYVELVVFHDRGSNLNVLSSANESPEFMMFRVG